MDMDVNVTCHYDGGDHSLTVERVEHSDEPTPRCCFTSFSDERGWRCFRDADGHVLKMRYDLADVSTDCSLVGMLLGPAAQGIARAVLEETRGDPHSFRSRTRHAV